MLISLFLFRLNEVDFLKFSDIENHDDFYILDEGRVHVQDQKGYYIVYDQAINDLKYVKLQLILNIFFNFLHIHFDWDSFV